ncbi:acetyl-CoA carboxylase biotin carboxyl carrier protein [Crocinitomicaceae bacterium CZZ-1]|uniref:Biotin carboxyl carrier protein of acetyl-CoA carboxylase n=1 Tax=Taishania pollutisoli TaxID=2766479 RepID=A0A8J6PG49_9FLAO|nr:acetyl-CoA carboxylase biotin carboxyl carrier protein [Taishania pollutisoli]MBC9813738.1 acetyl-CoA carboxylase biotin carboxyl carrier protein [Taishania pollutisoli]MBX2950750.1 acetyl-CoA carboxylase biotin carboxyl carrier protein [Crocinitomicaceae bacterium]NGF77251.1 acetyl-CoA carboxylase biotin carboxyl carrier protein [Fluviicola sp. SGL-29]
MNIKEIQDLIKFVAKAGVTEVEIEQKDFKITIKAAQETERQILVQAAAPAVQQLAAAPVALPATAAPTAPATPAAAPADTENSNLITVKSPMIGTFYRSPGPDKDAFVSVGQTINKGDTVCIIEAMKLFNEIESEVSGKIVKVLVDDASPVEYDQPLFLVDPA